MEYPQYDYAVIGGDMRQVYLAEELAHHQNRVIHYALAAVPDEGRYSDASSVVPATSLKEAIHSSNCIICPIPFCQDGIHLNQNALDNDLTISSLLDFLSEGQSFFAGCIPAEFGNKAHNTGVSIHDLMQDEALAVYNTIATAEGALCEAIRRSPQNLHGSQCAVLGYGKCGSTLVSYLRGMFCYVYACSAEPKERALAGTVTDRTGSLEEFAACAGEFDFVFNTIPAKILTSEILNHMKPSITIIDIASAPGGVDYTYARHMGQNAVLCPGLPGKYAPLSSAKAVKKVIESYMNSNNE